jgi:crotonobetainyl-CoA:carnitine CoA-transferase CaiB-like acyl-CoA transferase
MQPLAGITVVSLEVAVAAPFASRQLADLGARVIKIERPAGGDFARGYDQKARGLSSHFVWTNRSKESLTLNLKSAAGAEILEQLLAKADVFLHNLGPGAVERLGFAAERLRAAYPGLIICAVSGYGATGPYRDKRAYDLLIQAEAGLLSITGTAETPSKVGVSVADIAAGMYAFSGILTALLTRHQTGEGATIEVSMLEALGEWMGFPAYYALDGTSPSRNGASHASIAPYGPFAAADGAVVILGIQNEAEWRRFCAGVLKRPSLAEDERFSGNARRVTNRKAMQEIIEAVFSRLPGDEIVSRLEEAKIANGEMRTMEMFLDHPQLAARGRWREVDSPVGPLPALLPPVTMSGVEPVFQPIPALGEHTEKILAELGYDPSGIAQLQADQVL